MDFQIVGRCGLVPIIFFKTEMEEKFLMDQLLLMSNLVGKYVFDPYIFSRGDAGIPFIGGSDNSPALNEFSKIVEKYGKKIH